MVNCFFAGFSNFREAGVWTQKSMIDIFLELLHDYAFSPYALVTPAQGRSQPRNKCYASEPLEVYEKAQGGLGPDLIALYASPPTYGQCSETGDFKLWIEINLLRVAHTILIVRDLFIGHTSAIYWLTV